MPRPQRVDFEGAVHHVMNRGRNRDDVFGDDQDRQLLLDLCEEASSRFAIEILAYVLMSNHYHLLVRSLRGNLSAAMQFITSQFVQLIHERYGTDGAVFKGRFHSLLIRQESHMVELTRYIPNNPVKAGLVAKPEDFPWSSYAAHVGVAPSHRCLAEPGIVADWFEGDVAAYRNFVGAPRDHQGDQIVSILESPTPVADLTQALHQLAFSGIRGCLAVAGDLEISVLDLCRSVAPGRHRDLMVLTLLHELGLRTFDQLAQEFGYGHRASASNAKQRFLRICASDTALGHVLGEGRSLILNDEPQRAA